jgi:tetratricopeptide (TPR) repeat protein
VPSWRPQTVMDYYFLGVLSLWVATHPTDATVRRLREHPRAVAGVNWQTPLATAERCFRTAITRDPQHYWAHLWLGLTLKAAGNLSDATQAFGTCIGLRSDCPCGYVHLAYTVLQQARQEADPGKRDLLNHWGIHHLEKATTLDPINLRALQVLGDIWYRRGVAHLRAGAYDQAGEDLKRTAWLDLAHAAAPAGPARLSNRQALFRDALERLQNDNPAGYRNACTDLVNALEAAPDPQTAEAVAWVCVVGPGAITPGEDAKKGQVSRGLSPFDWVRQWVADIRDGDGPRRGSPHTVLAATLYRKGQFADALRELQAVVARHSHRGTAVDCLLMALTHRRLGQTREAQAWLERALDRPPVPLQAGSYASPGSPTWNERLACSLLLREMASELKEAEARATVGAALASRGPFEAAMVLSLAAGSEVGWPSGTRPAGSSRGEATP